MSHLVHVFAGPSLPPSARPHLPGVVFHEPAAQGDVYALVAAKPLAIALLDGYFERVASVWHKEILWAMSQGIHVVGAASMGALRAAELVDFGMVGVGRIFEDYAAQRLTDDDEVTLVHADISFEYRPISEAMVNLRATLRRAESEGVLAERERCVLELDAKQRFYADRSYPALLESARSELSEASFRSFAAWLRDPLQRVDQKRQDALAALKYLVNFRDGNPGPLVVPWTFQHTDAWEQVRLNFVRQIGERARATAAMPESRSPLGPLAIQAEIRALRIQLARQAGFRPDAEDVRRAAADFCSAHGLRDHEALRAFLTGKGLELSEFERLMADEARLRYAAFAFEHDEGAAIRDLRLVRGEDARDEMLDRVAVLH